MKNFLTILLSGIFLISFIACNEDDEEPSITQQVPLEGTLWVTTDYAVSGCDNPNDNGVESGLSCTSSECESLLLQNGQLAVKNVSGGILDELMVGSYTVSGNTLMATFEDDGQTQNLSIDFVLAGSVLTIDFTEPDGCNRVITFKAQQTPYVEVPLEGTSWVSTAFLATNCTDPGDNSEETGLTCTSTDCETLTLQNGVFTLNAVYDGTPENMTGTYTKNSGNTLSVSFDMEGETVSFDIDYTLILGVLVFDFTDPSGCDILQVFQAQ